MAPLQAGPSHDLYLVLGIGRESSADEVKAAFRRAAKRHHPDLQERGADLARAALAFRRATEAYDVLGDAEARRSYDRAHRFAGWTPGAAAAAAQASAAAAASARSSDGVDAGAAQALRAAQFAQRYSWSSPSSARPAAGSARPVDPGKHIDFAEWCRMQFGPDEEDRAAWAWRKISQARQARGAAAGGPSADPRFSAHASWEARRSARLQAAAMGMGAAWPGSTSAAAGIAPFADRGMSETGHYRAFAERYRQSAAAERSMPPAALLLWGLVFAAGYAFATRANAPAPRERPSGRAGGTAVPVVADAHR